MAELKSKCDAIAKRQRERKDIEAKSREVEVEVLRYQEKKLDQFLKFVDGQVKKWKYVSVIN